MRSKDFYCGLVLIGIGGWITWEASDFPALGGMPYGAGLFPTISAIGMCLCGLFILISSFISVPEPVPQEVQNEDGGTRLRGLFNVFAVIAGVVFYALFLDTLGFHLVSFLVLFTLFLILQVRLLTALILAVTVSFGVHFIFYSLLHVPLPWGLAERFAW